MRCLIVGDVVARPGRRVLARGLRRLRETHAADFTIVNGENAARGNGIKPQHADEIFHAGADVITTGNHVWDRREIEPYIEREERLLRPANYPEPAPGRGVVVVPTEACGPVAVVNLLGRLFMGDYDDPFRCADEILRELEGRAGVIVVDFHAEATSEKAAFAAHVDGRVTAVVGTHTHVATADERVLAGGTAFITDLGMTGVQDSVIGVDTQAALERFRSQRPTRFSPAEGEAAIRGAVVEIDPESGRALSIERVHWRAGDV